MAKQANMITELLMLSAGLAPVDVDTGEDPIARIKKMMSMLSESDRRIAARKLWRKAYRRDGIDIEQGRKPTSSEMRRRVWMVWQMFADDQKTSND